MHHPQNEGEKPKDENLYRLMQVSSPLISSSSFPTSSVFLSRPYLLPDGAPLPSPPL